METSIFVGRLLGPAFIVLAIATVARQASFRVVIDAYTNSPALNYVVGLLALLGGLALVLVHNVWSPDWRVLITLIGWITILRGLVTIFAPQWIAGIGSRLLANRAAFLGSAALAFAIGAVLCFFAYSMWPCSGATVIAASCGM